MPYSTGRHFVQYPWQLLRVNGLNRRWVIIIANISEYTRTIIAIDLCGALVKYNRHVHYHLYAFTLSGTDISCFTLSVSRLKRIDTLNRMNLLLSKCILDLEPPPLPPDKFRWANKNEFKKQSLFLKEKCPLKLVPSLTQIYFGRPWLDIRLCNRVISAAIFMGFRSCFPFLKPFINDNRP